MQEVPHLCDKTPVSYLCSSIQSNSDTTGIQDSPEMNEKKKKCLRTLYSPPSIPPMSLMASTSRPSPWTCTQCSHGRWIIHDPSQYYQQWLPTKWTCPARIHSSILETARMSLLFWWYISLWWMDYHSPGTAKRGSGLFAFCPSRSSRHEGTCCSECFLTRYKWTRALLQYRNTPLPICRIYDYIVTLWRIAQYVL